MNHRYYCVNVSNSNETNSNIKRKESNSSSDFLQEKELREIYNTQYNDLFPKILSKTKSEFIFLLKEQVFLHLKIINKKVKNSLNSKYIDIFTIKYNNDKNKATKGLEDFKNNPKLQEKYLSELNCFIHCHKCSAIIHKCRNKMILYKNFIYCLVCQKVYNENQIKLYCPECKACYYTKLRYIFNKKYENFYQVSFKDYHCHLDEEETIKCLECGKELYYNISYDKNNNSKNSIREVFCLKCKLLYDLNEIYFKCKVCKSDFRSEAIIYSSFSLMKKQFLLIMHSLRKKKFAIPEIKINKECKCDISKIKKYVHQNDNGILYLGQNLEGQYVIICDRCYLVFKYNEFLWNCPTCGLNFKSKKIIHKMKKTATLNELNNINNEIIEKRKYIFKSPPQFKNIERKKNIENALSSEWLNKTNSDNNVNNLYKRNNTKINNNKYKTNYQTKIIFLANNDDSISNFNLTDKKEKICKRIKDINYNYYNSINRNYKEMDLRKHNFKNNNIANNNIINSLNYISLSSNNKSESNTNPFTDSTTNLTNKHYDKISDKKFNDINLNNNVCKCTNCLCDCECQIKLYSDKNVDDFNGKEKDKIENKEKNEGNNNIKKSKSLIEIENSINKETISRDNLTKNEEKRTNNQNKNETKKFMNKGKKIDKNKIQYFVKKKVSKNHENVEIKKINLSDFNDLNDKDSFNLDSIENIKVIKTEVNWTNNNNKNFIPQNKLKNISNQKNSINKVKKSKNFMKNIKVIKSLKKIDKNKRNVPINKNINRNRNNNNPNKDEIKVTEKTKEIITKKTNSKQINKFISPVRNINKNYKTINKSNNKNNDNIKKINDLNKKSNSILNKIKDYYEDFKKEDNLSNNCPNNKKWDSCQRKRQNDTKKKIKANIDFKSDNYTILKILGNGSFGKTYLVEDPKTKEKFALKKININDKIELKENQDEYNLILKLTEKFPDLNIVHIYGIELKKLDKFNTVMYVLMEAGNCDWEKEIINRYKNRAFYKEKHLMLILNQLIKTFSILQKNGISHRDVKPQNILCFGEKGYKISDFGEAKNFRKNFVEKNIKNDYEDITMKQTLRGTELYMSPILFHALRTHPYQLVKYNSFKSDVFSLGMCFFLASSLNFEGLYEVREIISNPIKTKMVVNKYLNQKYSQKYINLLISMLQIEE